MAGFKDVQAYARRQGAPVTVAIMGTLIVLSLLFWFLANRGLEFLAFSTADALTRPWTALTYAFAFNGLTNPMAMLFFVFLLFWLQFVGGAVERDLGSQRFAMFFGLMTLLGAIGVGLGAMVTGRPWLEAGPSLPIGALTVAWGMRNPGATIRMYGIIPVSGKLLAVVTALFVLFGYGFGAPLVGVLALLPLAAAFLLATERIPGYGRPRVKATQTNRFRVADEGKYFDDVRRREKEREERERLRKLFEDSLKDDAS